ncbi:hypothetical protein B0H12DRAFT_1125071 [Mycena haematopus]|nr:hypothetical protein B0H12DRAFT_1125071 [Mycena haematopus]
MHLEPTGFESRRTSPSGSDRNAVADNEAAPLHLRRIASDRGVAAVTNIVSPGAYRSDDSIPVVAGDDDGDIETGQVAHQGGDCRGCSTRRRDCTLAALVGGWWGHMVCGSGGGGRKGKNRYGCIKPWKLGEHVQGLISSVDVKAQSLGERSSNDLGRSTKRLLYVFRRGEH